MGKMQNNSSSYKIKENTIIIMLYTMREEIAIHE